MKIDKQLILEMVDRSKGVKIKVNPKLLDNNYQQYQQQKKSSGSPVLPGLALAAGAAALTLGN